MHSIVPVPSHNLRYPSVTTPTQQLCTPPPPPSHLLPPFFAFLLLSHSALSSSSLPLNSPSLSSSSCPFPFDTDTSPTLTKSPAFKLAYSCLRITSLNPSFPGSTSCSGVSPPLFFTLALDPASSIISTNAFPNSRCAGGSELIHRIAQCKGVSPSERLIGSHSKPGWSRRASMTS